MGVVLYGKVARSPRNGTPKLTRKCSREIISGHCKLPARTSRPQATQREYSSSETTTIAATAATKSCNRQLSTSVSLGSVFKLIQWHQIDILCANFKMSPRLQRNSNYVARDARKQFSPRRRATFCSIDTTPPPFHMQWLCLRGCRNWQKQKLTWQQKLIVIRMKLKQLYTRFLLQTIMDCIRQQRKVLFCKPKHYNIYTLQLIYL